MINKNEVRKLLVGLLTAEETNDKKYTQWVQGLNAALSMKNVQIAKALYDLERDMPMQPRRS